MRSTRKRIAWQFVEACVLGDLDAAATFLDSDVELIDQGHGHFSLSPPRVAHGIEQVLERFDTAREDEEIVWGNRKLKEVEEEVVRLSTSWTAYLPSDGYGPSKSGSCDLVLTFRGNKITRIESFPNFGIWT